MNQPSSLEKAFCSPSLTGAWLQLSSPSSERAHISKAGPRLHVAGDDLRLLILLPPPFHVGFLVYFVVALFLA